MKFYSNVKNRTRPHFTINKTQVQLLPLEARYMRSCWYYFHNERFVFGLFCLGVDVHWGSPACHSSHWSVTKPLKSTHTVIEKRRHPRISIYNNSVKTPWLQTRKRGLLFWLWAGVFCSSALNGLYDISCILLLVGCRLSMFYLPTIYLISIYLIYVIYLSYIYYLFISCIYHSIYGFIVAFIILWF